MSLPSGFAFTKAFSKVSASADFSLVEELSAAALVAVAAVSDAVELALSLLEEQPVRASALAIATATRET